MVISIVSKIFKQIQNILIVLFIIIILITTIESSTNDDEEIAKLSFCDDENARTINRRLIYVATLDGKLTALDLSKDGNVHWSITTGPGPLISSSIHRLELTNNGQWVRMIPSLSGGLYKFNGETIDPIPISADNLLSSSFKFSDDLVISGGKETRSYGVSARTGQVLYECSMNGCVNDTESISLSNHQKHVPTSDMNDVINEHDPLLDDVIVVRRQTQTVRAIEPRSGNERWNFSVGQHELELLKSPDCHNKPFSEDDLATLPLDIKVVVPEGIICVFDKRTPNTILWKYQFDYPIVSAWKTDKDDNLKSIDLFGSAQWIWNGEREEIIEQEGLLSPSIYLGMFQKQLYIQESKKLEQFINEQTYNFNQNLITNENKLPKIPWKPYPATSSGLILLAEDATSGAADNNQIIHKNQQNKDDDDDENTSTTALSVLYASEYVNGNGFYLYTSKDLNKTENALCDSKNTTSTSNTPKNDNAYNFDFTDDDTPANLIMALLFWWKEILVISLTSAVVLNLLLAPKIRDERAFVVIERQVPVPTAMEAIEDESLTRNRNSGLVTQRSLSESNSNTSETFTSRFSNDFDLVQCLGKGGFGVVFEAKNKIDDCNYAIKRIILPNKKESRDRVMREVKTLANCEHHNIVRYFQAWVETPPPGWQETEDQKWLELNNLSTSIEIETPDGTTLPPFPKDTYSNTSNDYASKNKHKSWIMNFNKKEIYNFEDSLNNDVSSLRYNNNNNLEDDSCSFIQFKNDDDDDDDKSISEVFHDNSKSINIPCENELSETSFEIEFQNSTNDKNLNDLTNYSKSYTKSISKKFTHKRPMSLDLSSQGNVILPIGQLSSQQLQSTINKCQNKVYLYIQMQLCRKQSLKDWLREHKLDKRLPNINSIFEQIVDAVDYVHYKGLIHRDLKPGNIFFSLDGQIKIGDFGLVTDMSYSNGNTTNGNNNNHSQLIVQGRHTQKVGTHLYMSPEQLEGLSYDSKVDIYALGVILFELLVDFGTEMERIETLKGLRNGKFPINFQEIFQYEYNLLKSMLSIEPIMRPDTRKIKEKLIEKKLQNSS